MLDELSQIQSRIGEIQARLDALAPRASNPPAVPFSETLTRMQMPPGVDSPANLPPADGVPSVSMPPVRPGVSVPPAALGALSPLSAGQILPMPVKTVGDYDDLVQTYAAKNGVSPALVKAVIQTESGGDVKAISKAGAMGLMQLMPENVKEAGVSDPFDAEQNIAAGTSQLGHLMKTYGGDLDLTLAGYNAGPGNVRKYGGVPPFAETQNYIKKVKAAMGENGQTEARP